MMAIRCVEGMSAPVHDDDESLELRLCEFQRGFVRGAAHADSEVESASPGKVALNQQHWHLVIDHKVLKRVRVGVEVVGLDFPDSASGKR